MSSVVKDGCVGFELELELELALGFACGMMARKVSWLYGAERFIGYRMSKSREYR